MRLPRLLADMDDWKPRIEEWQARLAEWQRRFDEEYVKLGRARKGLFRKLSDADRDEIAVRARAIVGEELPVELFGFLSELCDAYLAEPLPAPRAKVRAWVNNDPTTMNAAWSYA